jgi:hypothetical protein
MSKEPFDKRMAEAKRRNKRQVTGHRSPSNPHASDVAVSTNINLAPAPSQQVTHHLTPIAHQ